MTIEFFIPLLVEPKQTKENVWAVTRTGKRYMSRKTPDKVAANAKTLAAFAMEYKPRVPLRGCLALYAVFQFPWRKGDSQTCRQQGPRPKGTNPDLTQLVKQLEDVLEAVGFFKNDAQISHYHIDKAWANVAGVNLRLEHIPSNKVIYGVHG